jgi:N-formylglutamate amidohydrolase
MYPETILPIAAHIPHAGTQVPDVIRYQFLAEPAKLWQEIAAVTDWYTDELFGIPGIAVTQTPVSRVVVDLERYADDSKEGKATFGQGVIYTHNTLREPIRVQPSAQERQLLLDNYYRPWHLQLQLNIEQQLARWGHCLLLDCHSFPDEPFAHEEDHGQPRPDICLGSCGNTPSWLLNSCLNLFKQYGYSVEVDFPYSGCLVPASFHGNERVPAIMIEVNRRLYLQPGSRYVYSLGEVPAKSDKFDAVKSDIWSAVLTLAQILTCRATTATAQNPIPRAGDKCPTGFYKSGQYCVKYGE